MTGHGWVVEAKGFVAAVGVEVEAVDESGGVGLEPALD
jgi:hypothetical protein